MTELHNNNVYYSSINWLDRDNSNSNNPQVNKASFHQLPPIQQMNNSPGMDSIAHHANKMYPNANWKENNNFDEDHSQYGQPTPSPSASTERSSSSRSRKRGVPSTKEIHVEKNTEGKPPYSYATLIKYAIENSEKKKLTLSEIYQWVIDHYPYYSSAGTGWKNSIRHNLSLNKSFVRVPRPINEPGKGSYWQVDYRAVAESDSRTKITMRNRGSRSGSDPAKIPPYHLPDDHYHQRFNRDTRSLSLDSNMSTKLAISASSNSSSSSPATNMSFYPAPFSAFAVGYDNRHFGHHHHHHHHHRHSVDFTRSPYLTNYEMYTTPQPVDSPYSSHPHHIHRIQSTSSLPKSNATAPPTPSSSGPFYDSNDSNTQYIYSNTVVQQRHQQHPSSPIKKEPTDGCSTPQPTCNKPSSTMKNDGYEPWM